MPPPPELMEELVEEILLRFPPDDPASLVRAALVCKLWCRLISGTVFRRKFREFHRSPLLAMIHTGDWIKVDDDNGAPRYTDDNDRSLVRPVRVMPSLPISKYSFPTASFLRVHGDHYSWRDARHGRVLLYQHRPFRRTCRLAAWDPVTDELRHLPEIPCSTLDMFHLRATVVCAAAGGGCDHLDCHRGPFQVVFMVVEFIAIRLSVYSSEAGAWSHLPDFQRPIPRRLGGGYPHKPVVLIGGALYHLIQLKEEILRYDLATREVSAIPLPSKIHHLRRNIEVMSDDDGGLGFVVEKDVPLPFEIRHRLRLSTDDRMSDDGGGLGFVAHKKTKKLTRKKKKKYKLGR